MKDDHDHVSHCWHAGESLSPAVPAGHYAVQRCCQCPATREVFIAKGDLL